MGELNGTMAVPISATWSCKHGVHVVIDFGEFEVESGAIFKTKDEAEATVDLMMQGINELFEKIPAPEMHDQSKFALDTLAILFAHMTTPQAAAKH